MKVKEFTLAVGYTYQPAAYHSAKGEASLTVIVEEGDDLDALREEARQDLLRNLVFNLAGVEGVHEKIHGKGYDVEDLVEEIMKDPDIMEEAKDGEWD